jgi:beta-galactosidase
MISLCSCWEFTEHWTEAFLRGEAEGEPVRLPHNVRELPLHYAGPQDYEMVCGYRRTLQIPAGCEDRRLFLQFDGAAHIATVYVNGKACAEHRCGYTAFRVEVTDLVDLQGENTVAVKLDCTENGAVPPFGFVIDYLTYGGLYRDAWLDIRGREYIEDLYVFTPGLDLLEARLEMTDPTRLVRLSVWDGDRCLASALGNTMFTLRVPGAKPWSPEDPKRYLCRAELLDEDRRVIDSTETRFGFRTVRFQADGFYLNGRKSYLRGLNRHQSYPGIGYAATESLQREDARILKEELSCTAVRTSHYPQSPYFIDECDRLGLLVFTEIPGWQHIGGESWKDQAVRNVEEMVRQYRNHPSIVLWGVRINESQDDDAFYLRTNDLCHRLDPSRPTSGVRFLQKSSLLEDVYAYNDFSHVGNNLGVLPKKQVSTHPERALLVSEHNGHMFPTKSYDTWAKRQEQALRHARVQNDARADGEHAGCFGWCMFDYATHKDFGSGDKICYHGVMDAFRNPKLAAALYASQGEETPVLELGTPMEIGDYPGGNLGELYVFTNADEVALYKNDSFVKSFRPKGWKGLPHGPVQIDDTIGCLLETQEGFDKTKAALVKKLLLNLGKHGPSKLDLEDKAIGLALMTRYGMSVKDVSELYGKYIGNWGGEATVWRFEGKKDGKVIASAVRCPGQDLHLEVKVSSLRLREGDRYDMAAVRIRVLDEHDCLAPYAQLPLQLRAEGAVALAGPELVCAEGGSTGCYVKTTGETGGGVLHIRCGQCAPLTLRFTVEA